MDPTGEWVIGDTGGYTDDNQRVMGVYSPEGKWRGEVAEDRMEKLSNLFRKAVEDPATQAKHKPKSFPREMGRLLARYKSGVKVGDTGRKVSMRNHWATPRKLLHTIYEAFQ
eukprot:555291-Prorocentrum_minimum.AAC.1